MVDPVLAPESDWLRMWLDVYGPSFPMGSLEGRVPASGVSWSGGVSVSQPWRVKRVRLSREEGLGAGSGCPPRACGPWPSRTLAFGSLPQPVPRWLRPPLGDNAANRSFWSTLMTEHLQPTQLAHRGQRHLLSQAAGLGRVTTAADATQC